MRIMLDGKEEKGISLEEEIHLRDYFNIILKRKWTIITFFILLVTIVTILTFKIEPLYRATSQILIERENPNIVKIEEVMAIDASSTDYYQTQYEILKSRKLTERVIKHLNLDNSSEFKDKPKTQLKIWLETVVNTALEAIKQTINLKQKEQNKEYLLDKKTQLINTYLGKLKIDPVGNSRLVNISYEAHDSKLAAQIANTHAKLYIEQSLDWKFSTSKEAVTWLNKRMKEVKKKLQKSEQALHNYKKINDLVSIDFGDGHNIHVQKLNELSATLTKLKTARIEKETLYKELEKISGNPEMVESIKAVADNSLIQQIKREYIKIKVTYSELSGKYGSEHPQMIRLRSEIKELEIKIALEVKKIAKNIETEYNIAKGQEESLTAVLEEEKQKMMILNEKAIQYNVLKREVETNCTLYESLLKRLKEASVTGSLKASNITIVDPARTPNIPFKPNKKLNILLAVMGGLIMGTGLAFFFEYLDNTIKTPEEVERYLGVPSLGYIGRITSRNGNPHNAELIALTEPKSQISEMLRNIRTNILFSTSDRPRKVILVTSAGQGEGKTSLTANLAISLAQMGKKVVLVDADLRKPRLHKIFNSRESSGLTNILIEHNNLKSAIQDTELENLKFIVHGAIPPNPAELLSSKAMVNILDKLKEQFDFVLFDSPPAMSVTDAAILSTLADGVIIVIKAGETPKPPIQRTIQHLSEINANLLGIVLNGVNFKKNGYYYQYYYKYYYGYGYGEEVGKKRKR